MKVGIIGYGFVGQAIGGTFNSDVELCVLDPRYTALNYQDFIDVKPDVIFICVPTPTVNGSCKDEIVVDYVRRLKDYNGLLVVKSTIPLSTVDKIMELRDTTVVWPELLREKEAAHDALFPSLIVLGAIHSDSHDALENFIFKHTGIQIHRSDSSSRICRVTPKEASIFKYAVNSFLAMKVLFMHQMYKWLESRGDGDSWETISELLKQEGRIGCTHLSVPGDHGFGFAGTCFPKDVAALLEQVYREDRTIFPLLQSMKEQNEQLRKTNV